MQQGKIIRAVKRIAVFAVAGVASASPVFAQTAPSGVQSLIAAISFTDVIAGIFAIGVLVIGVDLAQLGYFKVRRIVKGSH